MDDVLLIDVFLDSIDDKELIVSDVLMFVIGSFYIIGNSKIFGLLNVLYCVFWCFRIF